MPNESTRSTLIMAAVLGGATTAYLLFFFLPNSRAQAAMRVELNEKQTFVLEAQKSRKICEQLEQELAQCERYNAEFGGQLVSRQELPALYSQLSQLAKIHKVATQKFEPRPEVPYETFRKVTVSLGVEGTFSAIHGLLRDIELLPAQIWPTDVKLHTARQPGGHVEGELTLVVFVDNPENSD